MPVSFSYSSFLLLRKLDFGLHIIMYFSKRQKTHRFVHLNRVCISLRLSIDREFGVIFFSDSDSNTQFLLKSNFRSIGSCPSRGVASFILNL